MNEDLECGDGINGYSISFIPRSWAIGKKMRQDGKSTWAFGPLRFSISRNLPTWNETKSGVKL